jgi:hypothetical protein
VVIEFQCPECRKVIRVQDELGGHKGKCPKCGLVVRIPFADVQPEEPLDVYEKGHYVRIDSPPPGHLRTAGQKTSMLAAIGLVLSILGVTAPFGVVLALLSFRALAETPGLKGRGVALAAIIIGAAWLVALPFILMGLAPVMKHYF